MIATDRDLLVYEPRLFNEAFFASQRVFDAPSAGSFDTAGTTLTATGAKWVDWNVTTGWVVLVADSPCEVAARFNQTQLFVSKIREDSTAAMVSAGSGSSLSVRVSTFRPQIQAAHDALMRGIGIEPTAVAAPGILTEANITNPKALLRAECLGTLAAVYQSVAVSAGEGSIAWAKARSYAERAAEERRRISIEIDTNADGKADAVRRFSAHWLTRA